MTRRAAKVDANHGEVVAAFRQCGATVQSLAPVGKGCPDLLVGYQGRNYLVEVKDGSKVPSARGLTSDQYEWVQEWRGQWDMAINLDDVERLVTTWAQGCKCSGDCTNDKGSCRA